MKNQVSIGMLICAWVSYSVSLIYLSVFMAMICCFHYYSSLIEIEIRVGDTSGSSFIVQDCFSYPYEVEYSSFKVRKVCVGILMDI